MDFAGDDDLNVGVGVVNKWVISTGERRVDCKTFSSTSYWSILFGIRGNEWWWLAVGEFNFFNDIFALALDELFVVIFVKPKIDAKTAILKK